MTSAASAPYYRIVESDFCMNYILPLPVIGIVIQVWLNNKIRTELNKIDFDHMHTDEYANRLVRATLLCNNLVRLNKGMCFRETRSNFLYLAAIVVSFIALYFNKYAAYITIALLLAQSLQYRKYAYYSSFDLQTVRFLLTKCPEPISLILNADDRKAFTTAKKSLQTQLEYYQPTTNERLLVRR